MFRLLLDTAVKTVAYRWQVIQIVETLVHSPDPLHPHQRGHRVRRLAGPADQGDDRRRLLCCISTCAVRRRHSTAGANPARQLSLQPVAVGADGGGNNIV